MKGSLVLFMKKKWFIICLIAVLVVGILSYVGIQKTHTFTLTSNAEQIQPLSDTISVKSDCDTDVVFTDIKTGETYMIGYITSGVTEKIKLEKDRWYTVESAGNLTINPINVRIE